MRIIYQASIATNSTQDEHAETDHFPTLVPASARIPVVYAGQNTAQDVDFASILGPGALQATHCTVQITGKDAQTDAQLRIDIEKSIDGLKWTQVSQQTGFTTTAAFAVNNAAYLRARTTTVASAGTQAFVTFMFTRTP
jgi:hypothetical protein